MWDKDEFIKRAQKMSKDKHTSLKAITKEIGVNPSFFTDIKKGRATPSIEKICLVADYFDVPLDYLIYGEQPQRTDISNFSECVFVQKFDKLPPKLKNCVISYMDGMLTTLDQDNINFSCKKGLQPQ